MREGGNVDELRVALEAARAQVHAAARGRVDFERLRAANDRALALERALGDAEGAEVAHLCPWDVPWSGGAPCPVVFADGQRTAVAYYPVEHWRPRESAPTLGEPGEPVAIVQFHGCTAHCFGPPNDEAMEGHPLWGRGLQMYGAHIVARSSWIHELERRNRVHPRHRPERYATLRHYLLCFHDETFECVARGHTFDVVQGILPRALVQWLGSGGATDPAP